AGRLQPVERKLRGDVLGSNVAPASAGAAAFQQIAGEELHLGADVLRINRNHGLLRCRRQSSDTRRCDNGFRRMSFGRTARRLREQQTCYHREKERKEDDSTHDEISSSSRGGTAKRPVRRRGARTQPRPTTKRPWRR